MAYVFNGQRLREAREARGLSRVDLASRIKVVENSVMRWEDGKAPDGVNALLLADELDLKPKELLIEVAEPVRVPA